jgi:hypothetical protein
MKHDSLPVKTEFYHDGEVMRLFVGEKWIGDLEWTSLTEGVAPCWCYMSLRGPLERAGSDEESAIADKLRREGYIR